MPPVSIRTLVIAEVLGAPVTLAAVGFISLLHGADSGDRRRYWLARRAAAGLAGLTVSGA